MKIEAALARYLQQLQADGRSQHTQKQYRRHIQLLARWSRNRTIRALSHEDLAHFLSDPIATLTPSGAPKKASAMNCLRSSIRTFFGYAHKAGYVAADPSRLVRRALCSPGPPRCMSIGEQKRLVAALDGAKSEEDRRDRMLFTLMLRSGIRLSSALSLDKSDVNLDDGTITLRNAKGGRVDSVRASNGVMRELSRYVRRRDGGPLFAALGRARRLGSRQAQRRFETWLERAGIERSYSPHALRHSFAQALYDRSRDLLLVQRALAHRSIASTLVYARCAPHA